MRGRQSTKRASEAYYPNCHALRTTHYALRPVTVLLIFFLTLLLVACGSQAKAEPTPPVIHYGEDICEFCGMIISEERFAAGYLTAEGEERIFDDVADMFKAHRQKQENVVAFFVHDYEDIQWIRAETAHYVLSDNLPTPMLNGLVACATQEKAETLATETGGQVFDFDAALAYYGENSALPKDNEMVDHQHP